MIMDKMTIYNHLPIFAQNLACFYEGSRIKFTRYGKDFWRFFREYEERNNWSYEQLCSYRDEKLRMMIKHCYKTVPYYNKLFNEGGINPEKIRTLDDLKTLPILTKYIVKDNIDTLISTDVPKGKIKVHYTSGTTGGGLGFRTTNTEESEQWAVWWRYRQNLGIGFDKWCGLFGGKVIVPIECNRAPFWRINMPGKQVFFSGYHINENNILSYVNEIKARNIKWLHGYPSNISNLASYMLSLGLNLEIEHVTVGAENLYDYQVELIKNAFGVEPYQHYGLTEGVANISQNTKRTLIVDEDFSCVEFILTESGENKIIGTTLTNWAMPLLRYDTGDYAILPKENYIINKGRIIEKLNGRSDEYILRSNGAKVSAAALSLIFHTFTKIRQSQIIQEEKNGIMVKLVVTPEYTSIDETHIIFALKERLGSEIKIKLDYVQSIPKTRNGKYLFIKSNVANK